MKHLIVAAILIGSAVFAGCGGAGDVPAELKTAEASVPESVNPGAAASADAEITMISSETAAAETTASAERSSAASGAADEVSVPEEKIILPAAPYDLAVEDCGSTMLTIRWKAASGASGYNIYRAPSLTGPYTKLNAAASAAALFTDENLSESTLYCYRVSAVNAAGESALSSAVSQRTANSSMAYVRFCNLGSVSIAGMRLGRSWFRPVKVGETTSYVEALPGTYFFEYWNAETLEWETISTGMFTLQAGRRYTVRDADAAAYLVTDDVLKREDAAVFIENMSSSKSPASASHVTK